MMQWFRSLSINTLALMAIVAGLGIIIFSDPPKTACDAELDQFRTELRGFLYVDSKAFVKEVPYFRMADNCRRGNGPGACLELFAGLRKMLTQSSSISEQCLPQFGALNEVKGSMKRSLDVMVRMAWGSSPPATPNLKAGWFDPSDLNLFCRMKSAVINWYGEPVWTGFQDSYFTELPGAQGLPRSEIWEKSLLSISCGKYL